MLNILKKPANLIIILKTFSFKENRLLHRNGHVFNQSRAHVAKVPMLGVLFN